MAAWIKQLAKQVAKHGAENASWYCEWDEPDGTRRCKSCGAGKKGKRLAQDLADKMTAQLTLGTYASDRDGRMTWEEFCDLYKRQALIARNRAVGTVADAIESLDNFARLAGMKGKTMDGVTQSKVDTFIELRGKEPGRKPGSKVSPATINKDLRSIKAALRWAAKPTRKYIKTVPEFVFVKEPDRLPQYITPEHFAAIYEKCGEARFPNEGNFTAAEWWQALLMFAQMTGWRIGEMLSLQWQDVDLERGVALTRADDNKGKRDSLVPLHPIVIEHIRPLKAFHPNVFPWENHRRTLDVEFARIQDAAGIALSCPITGKVKGVDPAPGAAHQCTDACHRYSFHDERRAFATLNQQLDGPVLQVLMRHKSYQTTLGYINSAKRLNPAVAVLHVPTGLEIREVARSIS